MGIAIRYIRIACYTLLIRKIGVYIFTISSIVDADIGSVH